MNSCTIYRNDKRYIIIAAYYDPAGCFALSFPVYFLSISASNEELYTSISNAIRATKSTKYEDLDVKSFLKAIKVPSLKKLYQDYTTCLIMDTGTEIKIERYIFDGKYRESDGTQTYDKSLLSSHELVNNVISALDYGDNNQWIVNCFHKTFLTQENAI